MIVFLLVAFLTLGRTVLDASALVAMIPKLLDALRADRALLVHFEGRFVCFAGNSVRGAKTAVNKKDFGTGSGEVRTNRPFCTCRCSTLRSCIRHTGDFHPQSARHSQRSARTCLAFGMHPYDRW
jgi:hypothetical protein